VLREIHHDQAPDDPIALWNVALIDMTLGRFEAGWAGREIRWKTGLGMKAPNFIQPQWLGDRSIESKTVLLFADEGIGDCFQFARYKPMVAELGAKVILAVQEPAVSLLSRMPGVVECIPKSTTFLPAFDLHCGVSSLPLAFKTTLDTNPATTPYLPAPLAVRTSEWKQRLGSHDRLRVGLVWSGNPGNANDRNRSLPLQMLANLLDVDAQFVSLQKNPRASDREILGGFDILDIADELSGFDETAALMACLDLVITVDTSVAHLAGGLGCRSGFCYPTGRTIAGCSIARIRPGTRPRACSDRTKGETTAEYWIRFVANWLMLSMAKGSTRPTILSGASREIRLPIRSVRRNPAGSRPA
jgi:hypothetical protein